MSAKSFDHFLTFWQQLLQSPKSRPAGGRRVVRAKSRLRQALVSR